MNKKRHVIPVTVEEVMESGEKWKRSPLFSLLPPSCFSGPSTWNRTASSLKFTILGGLWLWETAHYYSEQADSCNMQSLSFNVHWEGLADWIGQNLLYRTRAKYLQNCEYLWKKFLVHSKPRRGGWTALKFLITAGHSKMSSRKRDKKWISRFRAT